MLFFTKKNWPEAPIYISAPNVSRLIQYSNQWQSQTGRPPSDAEISSMIQFETGREILFQEALKRGWHKLDQVVRQRLLKNMRFLSSDELQEESEHRLIDQALELSLHENDVVVRQRLIQIMELMAGLRFENMAAPVDLLQQRYLQRKDQYYQSATLSLRHIFIRYESGVDSVAEAEQVLQKLQGQEKITSDPFMHGLNFSNIDERQVETYFGSDFQQVLLAAATVTKEGTWFGPLRSAYGEHLVMIERYQPRQVLAFDQVTSKLEAEWRREKQQEAVEKLIEQLRPFYIVGPAES